MQWVVGVGVIMNISAGESGLIQHLEKNMLFRKMQKTVQFGIAAGFVVEE